jgi:hypothetical protein
VNGSRVGWVRSSDEEAECSSYKGAQRRI